MYLETRKVSRKTPGDGKLELTATTYSSLAGAGDSLRASMQGRIDACTLTSFECTCDRGGGAHTHYFAHSPLFHSLRVDQIVRLDLAGRELQLLVTPLD